MAPKSSDIPGHGASNERIPCTFCLHTIDCNDPNEALREAVITPEGDYLHTACLTKMDEPLDTRPAQLPPPPRLFAVVREPTSTGVDIVNSLEDEPLGLSESRIYMQRLEAREFRVRNNSAQALMLMPRRSAPWLHVELTAPYGTASPVIESSGGVRLKPQESINVTLRPHPIRPARHRYRLCLNAESELIVYSNGIDAFVWLAIGSFLVAWIFLWLSFTSLVNMIDDLDLVFRNAPQIILTKTFSFYLSSVLTFTLLTTLMPAQVLWFTRACVSRVKQLRLLSDTTTRILEILDRRLMQGGAVSFRKDKVGELLRFFVAFSLVISLPWVIVMWIVTLLFVKVFMLGWLFYSIYFSVSIYFIFILLKNYNIIHNLNISKIDDSVEKLYSEITKRLGRTQD